MLFEPFQLNKTITLQNRIVMAPLTRCFADDNLVPTAQMRDYYARRADAGLIISEATIISPIAQGYPNTPGIYSDAQIDGWKKITDAVHAKGGKMFLQLWHTGRASHRVYHDGKLPVAPSAIGISGPVARQKGLTYETPRALELDEIKTTIADYIKAAENAIKAGFDGVEIHGANGYLIDQFLHQESNKRDDIYGGSLENRARFALEVTTGIIKAIGADRTAIRLSPGAYFNMSHVDGDQHCFDYLIEQLNSLGLAYVHVGIFNDAQTFDYLGGRVSHYLRQHYKGTLIGCGSYTILQATDELAKSAIDLVAIGRPFIANPDLIAKLKQAAPLVDYSESMLGALV